MADRYLCRCEKSVVSLDSWINHVYVLHYSQSSSNVGSLLDNTLSFPVDVLCYHNGGDAFHGKLFACLFLQHALVLLYLWFDGSMQGCIISNLLTQWRYCSCPLRHPYYLLITIHVMSLPIFFKLASPVSCQSHGCPKINKLYLVKGHEYCV